MVETWVDLKNHSVCLWKARESRYALFLFLSQLDTMETVADVDEFRVVDIDDGHN